MTSSNNKNDLEHLCQSAINNEMDINYQDQNGWTLLHRSASQDNDVICDLLINAGADVNVQNLHGNTALGIAALNGNNKAVEALIWGGADTSIKNNDGKTPDEIADSYARNLGSSTKIPTGLLIRKLPLEVKLQNSLPINQTKNRIKNFKP